MMTINNCRRLGKRFKVASMACLVPCLLLTACLIERQSMAQKIAQFPQVESDLEAIDSVLRLHPRIHEMDDGLRYSNVLNSTEVMARNYTGDTVVKGPFVNRYPVAMILERDSISVTTYDSLRARLIDANVRYVNATPDYTAFLLGGKLDNLWGFVRMQPGGLPPAVDDQIAGGRVSVVRPVGARWFYFGTS